MLGLARKNMSKITKEHVVIQRWFPANDPVATNVARLCILKEDLKLEYRGWLGQKIPELDMNQIPWRKLYFLRSIFKTMMEIHSAVHSLKMNQEFREALRQQPKPLQNAFDELNRITTAAHPLIKGYRNSLGGHVKEQSVSIALSKVSKDRTGFLEVDVAKKQFHFNFASELCMAILFDQYPEEQQREKAKEIIGELKKALPFKAIDAIVTAYVDSRKLLDSGERDKS